MTKKSRYLLAQELVSQANEICLKQRQKKHHFSQKEDIGHEILSETDLKVNELILSSISKSFPEDKIISEESANKPGESEYAWIIDPIDGTNNFVRGLPNFATAIACTFKDQPLFSVIGAPQLNIFAKAYLNKGTFVNGKRVKVSAKKTLATSFVAFDLGHKGRGKNIITPFSHLVDQCRYMFCYGSYSVSMIYLAMGKIDGYVHNNSCGIWDVLPGGLLVTEAGGLVSNAKGGKIEFESRSVLDSVSSNKLIHDQLIVNID